MLSSVSNRVWSGQGPIKRSRRSREAITKGDGEKSYQMCAMGSKHDWLVVEQTPLKNMSQLGWLSPIYGKAKNVPNHQPDEDVFFFHWHTFLSGNTGRHTKNSSNGSMTNPLNIKKKCCDRSWHICSQEVWAYQWSFRSFEIGCNLATACFDSALTARWQRVCLELLNLLQCGAP